MGWIKAFRFASNPQEGYTPVHYDTNAGAPLYDPDQGFGFVEQTCAIPARQVHVSSITSDGTGFYISEPKFEVDAGEVPEHYNHYGMAFRVNVPPGVYEVTVKLAAYSAEPWISVSGMNADLLLKAGTWDAAGKIKKQNIATFENGIWQYQYANGRNYIDIEIEPKIKNQKIGIEEITIKQLPPKERRKDALPTIFLLGDSTVKTYTFEEAPMSGWGQVFGHLFDESQVQVVNYAMGGRSFRNAYAEGRFNDLLISGRAGDIILIQFGHNDEREDERHRFGRGSTEVMYESYIKEVYIPVIRARGMIPILVTPLSRVNGEAKPGHVYANSFRNRKFPDVLKRLGPELQVPVIDLNSASIDYYNEIGVEATTAIFMSIEAGETPGKTNDGSYANGHPANKIDGTHYKEALSKQLSRLIVTECMMQGEKGERTLAEVASFLKPEVRKAITTGNWSEVYPEMAKDTMTGSGSYYRNQIEKLLQLGAMSKVVQGYFYPEQVITISEFIASLCKALHLEPTEIKGYSDGELTRETMAALLHDAYHLKFNAKPKFMADYNGHNVMDVTQYDPNLDSGALGIMYDPLVPFNQLTDIHQLDPKLTDKVRNAYELGLCRSEKGIVRGKNRNGTEFEPKRPVSRAKAAKAIYFIWVLAQPVLEENHL